MTARNDVREWLQKNGLGHVATDISAIESKWRAAGSKTRRNWWAVLAGTEGGEPCVVAGVTFPILATARARMGFLPSERAIEVPYEAPPIAPQGRWKTSNAHTPTETLAGPTVMVETHKPPASAKSQRPKVQQAPSRRAQRTPKAARKRSPSSDSPSALVVERFAQLDQVTIPLHDLVVLVGPQATGKSLVLELLKLAIDRNRIVRTLKQHGLNWSTDEELAALYFGAGFEKSWTDETTLTHDKAPMTLKEVANARARKGEDAVFYIPAHRTLAIADGWPRSFAQYQIETPFVARRFSEQILTALNLGLVGKGKIFPHDRRLKDAFRKLIDDAVFHGATLKLEVLGMRKQFVLEYEGGAARLPYMAWTAGQREFTPLLLGLYHLLPPGGGPKKKEIQWAIIEEPEMGLHPKAIVAVMAVVLDLLARGYKVALSTHSPTVLEVVWGMSRLKKAHNGASLLCKMMGLGDTPPVLKTAGDALKKTYGVVYLQHDDKTGKVISKDISNLDPGAEDPHEWGWGGLTGFSARVAEILTQTRSKG